MLAVFVWLPLILAWLLLRPQYEKKAAFYSAMILACLIVLAQLILSIMQFVPILLQGQIAWKLLIGLFILMIFYFDLQLLNEIQNRLKMKSISNAIEKTSLLSRRS